MVTPAKATLVNLNNKILRILQNKSIRTPVIELYKSYDTLSPSQLHDYQILLFVHKILYHADKLPPVLTHTLLKIDLFINIILGVN